MRISMNINDAKKQRGFLATSQQRKASNPLRSVWVEASAGTGKTKVLSDRVLRLLLNGVSPSKILCLTYTKAAAVEMSSRIAQRLSEWAVANDEELNKQLEMLLGCLPEKHSEFLQLQAMARKLFAVLLDTPGGMKIQTIHSFCQEILKRFPLEAKISPYFEVMDDRAKDEILERLKKNILADADVSVNLKIASAVGYLTSHVSEFSFPDIMKSITDNAGKIINLFKLYPQQELLLLELARRLDVNPTETEDEVKNQWLQNFDRDILRTMMTAWFNGTEKEIEKANFVASLLDRKWTITDYSLVKAIFLKKDGEPYAKYGTKKAVEFYPNINSDALNIADELIEIENRLTALRVFASTKAIIQIAEELIGGYQKYKFDNAKMDYDDLIMLTKNLLEDRSVADWVLFKLDGGIDNILIDEAQDTSPNQWGIVKSLTQEFFDGDRDNRTVFVVGDRKQSIYSFQGADPHEFEKMRQYFKSKAHNFDEINLEVSFRSTAAILDSVNTVFSDSVAKQGVVLENQDITHIPFRIGEGGKVEIWPLIEAEKDENPDVWLPPVERKVMNSTSSRLAKMIASKIRSMVGNDTLVSQGRKLQYKDFMILVQRRNAFVEELVRECKLAGVNVAGVDKIKLLEQVAVQDLVALGNFLLLPTDDLTLAVILKSPLFGLTDDDLFELCYNRGQASLWTRLGDNAKYKDIYADLQTVLNMADFVRPFELYSYVLTKMNGRKKFEERMGSEVDDGLDEFINLTINFEQEHIPTLQRFINWIGKDEVEVKRELEQSELDAVRIMTVHGSKGLQAPVVILPDTVRQVSSKKGMGMLWDELFYYPLASADYEKNCLRIKEQEKIDENEEYRRLLYVALTRAEDRLCICGYCQKNKPKDDCWYELCSKSLQQISDKQGDDFVYEVAQQCEPKTKKQEEKILMNFDKPDWLYDIPEQESPLAKPYTPSKPDEVDEEDALFSPLMEGNANRYRRGLVIHKLLQFLPDVKVEDKEPIIREFLRKNAPEFTEKQSNRIVEEVLALINNPRFAPLFMSGSRAEVPIMGEVNGKIISAQIDRLVELEDEVWIVDFKTNRPAANTPDEVQAVYVKQLAAYKELLEHIYEHKVVKTFILWTDSTQIMQIGN